MGMRAYLPTWLGGTTTAETAVNTASSHSIDEASALQSIGTSSATTSSTEADAQRLRDLVAGPLHKVRYTSSDVVEILQNAAVAQARKNVSLATQGFAVSGNAISPAEYGEHLIGTAHLIGLPLENVISALRERSPNPNDLKVAIDSIGGEISVCTETQIFFKKYEGIIDEFTRALSQSSEQPFVSERYERGHTGGFGYNYFVQAELKSVNGKGWFGGKRCGEAEITLKATQHGTPRVYHDYTFKNSRQEDWSVVPYNSIQIRINSKRALIGVKDLIVKLKARYPEIRFETKICFSPF